MYIYIGYYRPATVQRVHVDCETPALFIIDFMIIMIFSKAPSECSMFNVLNTTTLLCRLHILNIIYAFT